MLTSRAPLGMTTEEDGFKQTAFHGLGTRNTHTHTHTHTNTDSARVLLMGEMVYKKELIHVYKL